MRLGAVLGMALGWLGDPRAVVLVVLLGVVVLGGGRRWLQAVRLRRAVRRLAEPDVRPVEIRTLGEHGREGLLLMELFRLLETAPEAAQREAAGQALARLWERDQLVAEEEKAIVTRGFEVDWRARRRYPAGVSRPVPIVVRFGVPFLRSEGPGVRPEQLEWSYRIQGAERASLETDSAWRAGPIEVCVEVNMDDLPRASASPRRLVLQAKVRAAGGLSSHWEHALPHVAFPFEVDPRLEVNALLALPDAARGARFQAAIALEEEVKDEGTSSRFVPVGSDLMLRDPPFLVLRTPLPCDVACRVGVEIEGQPGVVPAGTLVVAGQGVEAAPGRVVHAWSPDPGAPWPMDRPGVCRLRLALIPDPGIGWADPDVRSVWPEALKTGWSEVAVVRR